LHQQTLARNRRLLFLVLAMFFEKLIEQHRVDLFVSNGFGLASGSLPRMARPLIGVLS
jgi:hypothetical protein